MSGPGDVYATARGPLTRLASRAAARARRRRHERFFALTGVHAVLQGLPRPADQSITRVLDIGCGRLGLRALEPELDIVGVDLGAVPDYPGPFVQADVLAGLPFSDGEFDLAYCSSVIEHVAPEDRTAFAAELRRVARTWFVQTPARSFPLEPHSLLPGAHWLSPALRKPYWRLGVAGSWEQIELLSRRELEALFEAPALPERFGPLVKSWVCIGSRSDDSRPTSPASPASPRSVDAQIVAEAVEHQEQQEHDPD